MKLSLLYSKPVAIAWLLLVALLAGLAIRQGPAFDSSILSLLPQSEQDPLAHRAGLQMNRDFSERLLLVLSGAEDVAVRRAMASMASALAQQAEIARVDWRVTDDDLSRRGSEMFPYRFAVLEAGVRERLLKGDFERLSEQALARLFAPLAGGASLIDDPFGVYFELQSQRQPAMKLQLVDSLLKVPDASMPSYLLVLTLADDPFSPALQQRVLAAIDAEQLRLGAAIERVQMSGMLLHAAAGAQQARTEISTIGLGSLIGVVGLMLLVFRSLRPLLLLVFPLLVGCIFASSASLLIFEKLHLVTFAFGAGLVGVSVDYALHFLCARRVAPARAVLPSIMPGLLLGLLSSVAAYAAQAMTPFPGLRQMAVFSVFGLCAAWLTVVLWYPWLTGGERERPLASADRLQRLRRSFPRLDRRPSLMLALMLALSLAGFEIWNGEARDDIRLLQTSPQHLLDQERELHRALGSSGGSRFLLIRGDSLQACLQLEESLQDALREMQLAGDFSGVQMLSSNLPSLARQAQNVELVERLYDAELAQLYSRLGLKQADLERARDALAEAAGERLGPESWLQQTGAADLRSLLISADTGAAATAIRFRGELSGSAVQRLQQVAENFQDVSFVDQVEVVSSLMGKHRLQVAGWVVMAYLVVFTVLLLRYRRDIWRILLPPLAASILTLAILLQFQAGINLFHLLALILVLGIGLDMGIFLVETDEASHTWLAVSLSACTSLLAFGLLALSETPVLHHFGMTVAIGLSLVWLLAPLMRRH